MHITFQHSSPLPVKTYGGIERMLFWHMKELVKQGHKVSLIGHPDSQVEEFGIEFISYDLNNPQKWIDLIPNNTDIIQLFYNYEVPNSNIPTVNSIGGNGKIGEFFTLNTAFVSKRHAKNLGSESYVYNGIDLDEYPFTPRSLSWENFLFLAKGSWKVKNLKDCIKVSKSLRKKLHIIGGRHWLPSKYIYSHGFLGGDQKKIIMDHCDALLFPVKWHEPFGLAVIEAMATGIPVIGSHYGSLPELISPETGLICKNYEEFKNALSTPKNHLFNSQEIRRYVENNFSISNFTYSFLKKYKTVLRGEKLNQTKPTWSLEKSADEMLNF